ncbi:MAG TPA: bifunctional phosphopantothenoylcysteine decarboxylase/phosphopantothenate--cysteine ligase CoaBC [Bacillota bacterium]|nr:bifunctional phosphopantothenoylcysteine decarboxylase/phosphopantothenate--cysteine ligase CoaBC [Bacillota bacterium]
MLRGKNILVCVSGGIAVYKACDLVSKLTQRGAHVKVIMSEGAQKFVSPLTFQALSRNPVYTDTFDEKDPEKIAHIDVADWADLCLIAPATAHMIGMLANGLADSMIPTTILATEAPVYIAPAMNVHMYAHPAVVKNMQQLSSWGYKFIEPGAGYLACGYVGKGRLEEPLTIIQVLEDQLDKQTPYQGKKVLISAGPTVETIDPVRYFTNRSTGKMGFALAEEAAELGADVTLVTGPVQLHTKHANIQRIDVTSAQEMYEQMMNAYKDANVVIKAAAVADYRPKHVHTEKMKKQPGDLSIELDRTIDILQTLGEQKTAQFLVGFAAETNEPIKHGLDKLQRKHLNAIVVNDVSAKGAGFGQDTNVVTYINEHEEQYPFALDTKEGIAHSILLQVMKDMEKKDEV